MTTVSPSKAKRLARTLLRENRKFKRSWRKIAKDFDGISHATICRIALSKGAWLPKDKDILVKLGLIVPRPPRPKQKTITQMSNLEVLEHFEKRMNAFNNELLRRGLSMRAGWNKEK
jgi:hypothetical protein